MRKNQGVKDLQIPRRCDTTVVTHSCNVSTMADPRFCGLNGYGIDDIADSTLFLYCSVSRLRTSASRSGRSISLPALETWFLWHPGFESKAEDLCAVLRRARSRSCGGSQRVRSDQNAQCVCPIMHDSLSTRWSRTRVFPLLPFLPLRWLLLHAYPGVEVFWVQYTRRALRVLVRSTVRIDREIGPSHGGRSKSVWVIGIKSVFPATEVPRAVSVSRKQFQDVVWVSGVAHRDLEFVSVTMRAWDSESHQN